MLPNNLETFTDIHEHEGLRIHLKTENPGSEIISVITRKQS